MTGLTYAEMSAQLAQLAERYAPSLRMTLGLASIADVDVFRWAIETRYPAGPTRPDAAVSLLAIPVVIDKELPLGVVEMRTGATVRRFDLYGETVAREREATLVRFLTTDEDAEDAADDKPAMEPECLRTGHGRCYNCERTAVLIWRYEIDPRHRQFLGCACDDGDICDRCFSGVADLESGDLIVCGGCFADQEYCTWSEWLDKRALPWLCAQCWKAVTAQEIEHVGRLEAANPF